MEEEREWLEAEKAYQQQVELNAYFLKNGTPSEDTTIEQKHLTEQLQLVAKMKREAKQKKKPTFDKHI